MTSGIFPLPLRRAAAMGLIMATTALPALATLDNEASLAGDMVREAVIELDRAKAADQRVSILRKAVEAMTVLEELSFSVIDNELARQTLSDLGAQAVTTDMLRLSLVEALSADIAGGDAGLKRDLESKAAVDAIGDPAYRSAAWSQLARSHMRLGQSAEAERLAMRAIEDARGIQRLRTRDGALRAAVLVFPFDGRHAGIIETATNEMTSASARSEIYRMEALARLVGDRKLSADDLVEISNNALKTKDYDRALQAARALERDESRRTELLAGLFEIARSEENETLGLQVLKSMARTRDQDRAMRKLIDLRLQRGKPIRAREFVALMLTTGPRIDAEIAIARAFDEQGYHQAALDTLRSLKVSPVDEPDGAADLVSAFASLSAYDLAKPLAVQIIDPESRSFAFSRLSKRLADDQRLDEAREALREVTEPDDLAHARSALARGLIRSDRLDEAQIILKDLPAGADRDRVLEELAKRHAASHNSGEARKLLEQIETADAKGRILTALARSLGNDRTQAIAALNEAGALLRTTADAGEDLVDLARAYAELGELQAADDLVAAMTDGSLKDEALRAISASLVRDGALDEAEARVSAFSEAARPSAVAALASARFEKAGDVEALVGAVTDLPYSVRIPALRAASETRARLLDKRMWLQDPSVEPLAPTEGSSHDAQKANFIFGRHVIQAPVPSTRSLAGIRMPDIFSLDAAAMRARVPAPQDGIAHLAILGFSPFSLEAFKLTSGGTAAIHQVQVSQQLTWPRYIAVEKGSVTLGTLLRDLPEATSSNLLVDKGDELLVRVPIIVLPGATLLLSGAEYSQYQLAAQSGAFIAVAGRLVVQDTEVIGYDEQKNGPAVADDADKAVFRPFITGWGGSELELAGSRFAMLGYDSSKAFGLTQSSGAAVQSLYAIEEKRPTGNIIDNSFENLRYGYYSYEASDVRLVGNEYRDNVVYGIDPHDRSHDLLIALNTAYGSQKKHGIIVSREVDDSFIVGNISIWNKGSGLMLDRTSSRNVVYANTAIANHGDGLTFYESGCNVAAANDFSRNLRAGIKVRNSTDVGLYDNRLHGNKTSGADVYVADLRASPEGRTRNFELDPYQPIATTVISGNLFAGNGNAINVDGASQTLLEANRFRDQRSNIYGGELRPLSPFLLQLGETSATLIGTSCQPKLETNACRFDGWSFQQQEELECTGISQPLQPGPNTERSGNNG
jgi:tetratricopeptide (TPR) repeat protein/nitrous oxidase accessory protein NosD